ncbi:MAG: metallopeptidase TldD-related protein [Eubacteriales bacterium]
MDKSLKSMINILKNRKDVDGWLINHAMTESHEFFFIKEKMDMNRTKQVTKNRLTVYKDYEKDGKTYKGSATTTLPPATTEAELNAALDDLVLGASFVQNENYDLVDKRENDAAPVPCSTAGKDPMELATSIIKALYSQDTHEDGRINSVELFLQRTKHRLLNSRGVDQAFTTYYGEIELIVDWLPTNGDAVEIFNVFRFSDVDLEKLKSLTKDALETARLRSSAVPMQDIGDVPVLLTRTSVPEFFGYFMQKASVEMVYQQYSDIKIGEKLQSEPITGDPVSLHLRPMIPGSSASRSIDADGVYLKDYTLYKDGALQQFHGSNRFSQYLGVPTTGHIENIEIEGGALSMIDLKKDPHLELIAFSDFQMNEITGDFGGEIRLGKYFDGKKTTYVTGGSISGNFKTVSSSMRLSSETHQQDNTICPEVLKLTGVAIANAG